MQTNHINLRVNQDMRGRDALNWDRSAIPSSELEFKEAAAACLRQRRGKQRQVLNTARNSQRVREVGEAGGRQLAEAEEKNKTSKVGSGYSEMPPARTVRTCGVCRMSGPADALHPTPPLLRHPAQDPQPLTTTLHPPYTSPASGLLPLPCLTLFFPPLKSFLQSLPSFPAPVPLLPFPQFCPLLSSSKSDYARGRPLNTLPFPLPFTSGTARGEEPITGR
ncbi:hypothetical protein E2C01_055085 [Portunus trituberculatus]|uniref:Uncharacterized protein n=1 Tax=Portunus trituberculatus TaxID=210409 RepID=A0A5B7GTS1_PORTR|nr:hypothetical protein [Portunus trituberculatus]